MFKSRTVFVIGAGASAEVELPIGKGLAQKLGELLDIQVDVFGRRVERGDQQIYSQLQRVVNEAPDEWRGNNLLTSAHELAQAMEMALSIDTFLETHSGNAELVLLGKLGIAKAILDAERGSWLASDEENRTPFSLRAVSSTWYVSLAQLMFTGVSADHPEQAFENVRFIVFNYDRCLQVFLTRALQVYFRLPILRAAEIVNGACILHPYGSLGPINAPGEVPFGTDRCDLLRIAQSLRTFSESIEDERVLSAIRDEMRKAETVVFLGFGFHDQNMDVLDDAAVKAEKKYCATRVLATTYAVSESDANIIRSRISFLLRGRPPKQIDDYIETFNGKCGPFFAEYWRSFTA